MEKTRLSKKRKIEALQKLLEYVESDNFGEVPGKIRNWDDGLCMALDSLHYWNEITLKAKVFIRELIKKEPHKYSYSLYVWKPGAKIPRIRWIKKQIKLLQG